MRIATNGAMGIVAGMSLLAFSSGVHADDAKTGGPTFTRDIAPILISHCVGCHRPGEMAPMVLQSYADVRPWAKAIRKAVVAKVMPPWDADPAYGKWANDISLSDAEIALVSAWVDQGAPEGDPKEMPQLPKFTEGWQLGEPDYVIELDAVKVPAEGPDLFPNLTAEVELPSDHWIRGVEVRPGDANVLHHVVVFNGAMAGGGGGLGNAGVLAWWAAGTPPVNYPEGMGRTLGKKTQLVANMHYHPNGKATKDVTRIGLHFGKGELQKVITPGTVGDVALDIAPHQKSYEINVKYKIDQDIRIISFFPHMHLRGKDAKYTAHFPDGRSEVLLSVPNYDFNWQWFYYPVEPTSIPDGSVIEVLTHHDNSAENPNNPNPDVRLRFGEQSDEEMMFAVFEFYPVEGKQPKMFKIQKRIEEHLAEQPSPDNFVISLNTGMIQVPAVLRLPQDGAGKLFIPFGGQMLGIPLEAAKWKGAKFVADMEVLGARGAAQITGEVMADGTIKGDFDLSKVEDVTPGGGAMSLQGFEGKRASAQ